MQVEGGGEGIPTFAGSFFGAEARPTRATAVVQLDPSAARELCNTGFRSLVFLACFTYNESMNTVIQLRSIDRSSPSPSPSLVSCSHTGVPAFSTTALRLYRLPNKTPMNPPPTTSPT